MEMCLFYFVLGKVGNSFHIAVIASIMFMFKSFISTQTEV